MFINKAEIIVRMIVGDRFGGFYFCFLCNKRSISVCRMFIFMIIYVLGFNMLVFLMKYKLFDELMKLYKKLFEC